MERTTLQIKINTDDDSFQPEPSIEISNILENIAKEIRRKGIEEKSIREVMGNTVGNISWVYM